MGRDEMDISRSCPLGVSCRCHFVALVAVDLLFSPSLLDKCMTIQRANCLMCVEHFRSRKTDEGIIAHIRIRMYSVCKKKKTGGWLKVTRRCVCDAGAGWFPFLPYPCLYGESPPHTYMWNICNLHLYETQCESRTSQLCTICHSY